MSVAKRLKLANGAMLATAVAFLLATFMAYGMENTLPLAIVAVCHISQIVLAGLFKLSYVVRLVCQKQLGVAIK